MYIQAIWWFGDLRTNSSQFSVEKVSNLCIDSCMKNYCVHKPKIDFSGSFLTHYYKNTIPWKDGILEQDLKSDTIQKLFQIKTAGKHRNHSSKIGKLQTWLSQNLISVQGLHDRSCDYRQYDKTSFFNMVLTPSVECPVNAPYYFHCFIWPFVPRGRYDSQSKVDFNSHWRHWQMYSWKYPRWMAYGPWVHRHTHMRFVCVCVCMKGGWHFGTSEAHCIKLLPENFF